VSDAGLRALLVDYGGVLTTNVFESFRGFCAGEGLSPDALLRLFVDDEEALDALHRLERGELGEREFELLLAARLDVSSEALTSRLFAGCRIDDGIADAVRRARAAGLPTGLVTNSWGEACYDRTLWPELFDAVVVSGEVGLRKPQPEIFALAAARLDVPASSCAFVDDLRSNVEAARTAGMTALLHRDTAATVAELERLLGL
jgi:epoxide hydrolase-like predicted phosphatase